MFGHDPQTVITYAGAYLKGLQTNGVAGCLKHFPGLGAVTTDPHFSLPTVSRSKADLHRIDLVPYKRMIRHNNPAMIMVTDVLMSAIDSQLPAELSPKVVDGVLRGELGYDGVVITDDLHMEGISRRWALPEAAVLAIIAGNDIIEAPESPSQVATVITALKLAVQKGRLSMQRVDQSVARILTMKMQYAIMK
jgi:beta-N-acetylhexosaminidase